MHSQVWGSCLEDPLSHQGKAVLIACLAWGVRREASV